MLNVLLILTNRLSIIVRSLFHLLTLTRRENDETAFFKSTIERP
ncbi:hypothetical protein EOK76_g1113 [Lacticaseibacillus paracasei]|nr:hypothetical protein EOK76_g1113 [Lacticaseibacillus paracasei]